MEGANKILLKEAHETIFAAEKDLLDNAGQTSPEVLDVENKTSMLKNLVLQPSWEKSAVNFAIEELRRARVRLDEKKAPGVDALRAQQETEAKLAALKKQEEEVAREKAKILAGDNAGPAVPTLTLTEQGEFFVTHTSIAYADQTVVNVVMQTTLIV